MTNETPTTSRNFGTAPLGETTLEYHKRVGPQIVAGGEFLSIDDHTDLDQLFRKVNNIRPAIVVSHWRGADGIVYHLLNMQGAEGWTVMTDAPKTVH